MSEIPARDLVGQAAGMVSVPGLVARANVPRATVLAVLRGQADADDHLVGRLLKVAEGIVAKQRAKASNAARKLEPPAAHAPLEAALAALDAGESSRFAAAKLEGVDHPAARRAQHLLRARSRNQAMQEIELALVLLAGPADGSRMAWCRPQHSEPARDERRRPW
jgi:hypothetical protein